MTHSIETTAEGTLLVRPSETFDFSEAEHFVEAVMAKLKTADQQVVIDFSITSYIDSSAIGALIALYKEMPPTAPKIELRNLHMNIEKIMRLCAMHNFFNIDKDNIGINVNEAWRYPGHGQTRH